MPKTVTTIGQEALLTIVMDVGVSLDQERLRRAFLVTEEVYRGIEHWTGVSMLEHVVGVLKVLAPFQPDEDTVIACLLHHTLVTNTLTLLEIEEQFGPKVRALVSGIHLLSHVSVERKRSSIDDLRVMLLSVSDDLRVILVTLCDRAHCLQFVDRIDKEVAKRESQDALQLYAPVAARLGIYSLKHELEERAFPVAYPDDAARIAEQIELLEKERPEFLDHVVTQLTNYLAEQNISAEVTARTKFPYSAFLKMQRKTLTDIRSVHDFYAVRVITASEEECYRVLGILHKVARPVPNRFKDYISFPKPNGYQSLHTTIMQIDGLPEHLFVEVQIRTENMDREANYGVAAHWSYKEHGATQRALEKAQLHTLLMGQQEIGEEGKATLADHIFVLTPRGDILEFPEGATPLDFAFQVHTDLGLSFRAARVNGSIVSLDYELQNGDVVDIIKDRTPHASPQWMNLLKMASSRAKLKRYLYAQERPEYIAKGREMVNIELRKHHFPPLTTDLSVMRNVGGKQLTMHEREDILMKIGQGAEKASSLLSRIDGLMPEVLTQETVEKTVQKVRSTKEAIGMQDDLRMPVRFAKCCAPDEGGKPEIVGNINREGKVMVHRKGCRMLRTANPERQVEVWWNI